VQELAEGNRILAEAVAYDHEERVHLETGERPRRRWEEAIAAEQGRLRPLPGEADLREIFRLHLERTVGKDGTFPFLGQRWSLNRAAASPPCAAAVDSGGTLLGAAGLTQGGRFFAKWGPPAAVRPAWQASPGR
jgi:hypothetical protein